MQRRLPPLGSTHADAGDLAALVAAFFFAAGGMRGVLRARPAGPAHLRGTRLLADMRSRSDTVFEQVHAAVDRANQQLDATSSVTVGMDELNVGVSQLTEQVSALAGLGRAMGRPRGPRRRPGLRRTPRRRDPPDGTGRPGAPSRRPRPWHQSRP